MSTGLLQIEAKRRLLTLITDELSNVSDLSVFYQMPPDVHTKKVVYLGEVEATSEVYALKATRMLRAVSFTLEVFCFVGPGGFTEHLIEDHPGDPGRYQAADEACLQLVAAIDEVLANPDKGGPSLILGGQPLDAGITASVQSINGPNPKFYTDMGGTGSEARVVVAFDSKLR